VRTADVVAASLLPAHPRDNGIICAWQSLRSPSKLAQQSSWVDALIVTVTPLGATGDLPLPALVGTGCDVADSGGGCRHPNTIAPVTPLTVAIDVATIDVHAAIEIDVPVDVHVPIDIAVMFARETLRLIFTFRKLALRWTLA